MKEFRFLLVGGINTLVGYGAYAIFIYVGLNYFLANTFSTIIGITNSYIWNRNFTFKSKGKVKNEIIRFISVYGVSYLLGMLTLFVLVKKIGMNEYITGFINLILTTLISWFGHKKYSFRGDKRK